MTNTALEKQLDAPEIDARLKALSGLLSAHPIRPVESGNVNLHCHSFFSYNADGFSPTRIAWRAWREGWYAVGLCDFDVLDGQQEFIEAGLALGLRCTVNLETRAYFKEYADRVINSPGEPGVIYLMGAGFASAVAAGTPQAATLAGLRQQAIERNRRLVARINPSLANVAIDYERDVAPLSPGGCPTERHIIRAYSKRAAAIMPDPATRALFWSGLLRQPAEEVARLLANSTVLEEKIRGRLVKKGGLGYEQPSAGSFPPAADFFAWVRACDAIPMFAWLDGSSEGEAKPLPLLKSLRAMGAAAVNIIPDRNWNFSDPAVQAAKTSKLREFVATAEALDLPINIGTEMNKDGLPSIDDLTVHALAPYRSVFKRGAQVFVGHMLLARYAGMPYCGPAALAEFDDDTAAKNKFFAAVGALPPLTADIAARLAEAGHARALAAIRDSAQNQRWQI